MNGQFKLKDTNNIKASVTLQMRVASWRLLAEQIDKTNDSFSYPMCDLKTVIRELIQKAETEIFAYGLEKTEEEK